MMQTFPRWMMSVLAAAVLAMGVGGVWYYSNQKRAVQQTAEAQLTSIGRLKVDQIAAWRGERLADAAVLTESPFFASGVARFLAEGPDANAQPFISRFRPLQAHCHYTDILLVDPRGRVLFSLIKETTLSKASRASLAAAFQERTPVVSELYISMQTQTPQLFVVAPIYPNAASDTPPIGAVVLVIDASQFLYPMVQSWPTPSQTAETLLVRRDGEDVLFLNKLRHQANAALKLRIPLSQTDKPSVMGVFGRQVVYQGKDYRGVEVLAVTLPIPDSRWSMVAKQDVTEIFAKWRSRTFLILALYIAMAGGLGAFGLFAWQRNQKRHYQMLYISEVRQQESERKYRLLFENMTTGYALHETIYDSNGRPIDFRFIEINPAVEKMLGLRAGNCIGRTLTQVGIYAEDYWINAFRKVIQSGEPLSCENYSRSLGRYLHVRAFSPAKDLLATMVLDITERKQAEEEARRSQLRKIESLRNMAGGVAHHYNNLMTVIMGNLDLGLDELPEKAAMSGKLTAAMSASRRASELGTKMLTYLGQTVVKRQPLDLAEICCRLLPELEVGIPKNVTMKSNLPEPGPMINGDANQIHLIIQGLITNASEAIGANPGVVSLNVRSASPADSKADHRRPIEFQPQSCDYCCLEVKDTGCGIEQIDFEELFDPFYTTKFTGRGLGLSLVLGAVQAHNGCITLESEPGQGSLFQIYLPMIAAADSSEIMGSAVNGTMNEA